MRQRQAFLAKAKAIPAVEDIKPSTTTPSTSRLTTARSSGSLAPPPTSSFFPYRNSSTTISDRAQRAGPVLLKIFNHMKRRHHEGDRFPLTFDEILEEIRGQTIDEKTKYWLRSEAMPTNPKLSTSYDDRGITKFQFRPPHDVKDSSDLLQILIEKQMDGQGGVIYEHLEESVGSDKAKVILDDLQLRDKVFVMGKAQDRKRVIYYIDSDVRELELPEWMKEKWNSVSVAGMDGKKITDYLEKSGFQAMQASANDRAATTTARLKSKRKTIARTLKQVTKHNEHVLDRLQDYSHVNK